MRLANITQESIDGYEKIVDRFKALGGVPSKKNEEYRYFDIESILKKEYKTLKYDPTLIQESEKITIVDGVVTTAPHGMRVYYKNFENISMEQFDPLYYVGHILSPRAIHIELDGDTEVEIEHQFTKSNALINYRIVLLNQVNRHASVYERFVTNDIQDTLVLYGYDMQIAKDSSLRVVKIQTMQNNQYSMIASHNINVEKNATALLKSFDLGGDQSLQLLKVTLDEYAHIDAGHLLYLNSTAKRGTISQIVHRGRDSTSKQNAKNILDGEARGIFDALIRVEESAKFTKAEQNSKSIILHDSAYMASKPQLEIYIDELEASHGATTGQLDPKQLFYLQSRGVSLVEARKMLVVAFANSLIEEIRDGRIKEQIQEAFEELFYTTNKE